jgi:hypothetical protein
MTRFPTASLGCFNRFSASAIDEGQMEQKKGSAQGGSSQSLQWLPAHTLHTCVAAVGRDVVIKHLIGSVIVSG